MERSTHTLAVKSQLWIETALFTLIQRKPFQEITISELCEQAMVSRRTFYRNFEDKQDVLFYYFSKLQKEYQELLHSLEQCDFQTFALSYFSFWRKHLDFLHSAKKDDTLLTMLLQQLNTFIPTLYQTHTQGTPYDIYFIIGGLHHILIAWIQSDFQDEPEAMVHQISMIINPSISFTPHTL